MICINNFSFGFNGSQRRIIEDIDLHIGSREFILVTGPSGCGKSTLSMCIAGFANNLGSSSGSIKIDGTDMVGGDAFEKSSLVGIVQQDPESQLVSLNVEEEVAFGPENLNLSREKIRERVDWGLGMAGAEHLKHRNTHELSGGEKQKVALASMLAMRPRVLIFDEPTSNLDPVATKEIFDSIISLREKTEMTIIVMEHKLKSLLRYADTLVIMDNGKIVSRGDPSKVLKEQDVKGLGIRVPHIKEHESKRAMAVNGKVLISAKDMSFSYGDKKVLDNVSFDGHEGEMICIMGENGSGKSTFIYNLMGFLRPQSGSLNIMGENAKNLKTSSIARDIGLVFQNPNHQIFENTLEREISFAARNFDSSLPDTDELLNRFNLPMDKDSRPFKISFGQKRRLNIASVFSYGPKAIILDEPFIGQDFVNATNIMSILDDLKMKDNLIMFVSHDPRMISKYCTRIIFFESGSILYDGPPEEVFAMMKRDGKHEFLPDHLVSTDDQV